MGKSAAVHGEFAIEVICKHLDFYVNIMLSGVEDYLHKPSSLLLTSDPMNSCH